MCGAERYHAFVRFTDHETGARDAPRQSSCGGILMHIARVEPDDMQRAVCSRQHGRVLVPQQPALAKADRPSPVVTSTSWASTVPAKGTEASSSV